MQDGQELPVDEKIRSFQVSDQKKNRLAEEHSICNQ